MNCKHIQKIAPKCSLNLDIDKNKNKMRSQKSFTLVPKLESSRRIEDGESIVQICNATELEKSTAQTIRDGKGENKMHSLSSSPLNVSKLTSQRSNIMEKWENY